MKIALEGKMNKCTDDECKTWRDKVIAELGDIYDFHNPMDFDCRGKEQELEKELVYYDTIGIASSDIILVLAEEPSWGTAMAVQMAWDMGKYIVTVWDDDAISPWLNNRSDAVEPDLDAAIVSLKEMAHA